MNIVSGVTVVVPVLNGGQTIRPLLESLLASTYPRDLYEIIIVDNGSSDETTSIVRQYPAVLLELRDIKSSYAARNLGVARARFSTIAFTDADCRVDHRWLAEGVRAMAEHHADLVAGRIQFTFSENPSAAELYDSLVHMRNDILVESKRRAVTANLFVKARLFEDIGPFPEVTSGGDGTWTTRAVGQGRTLRYAPDAIVLHPARGLKEVMTKSARVGRGFGANMAAKPLRTRIRLVALSVIPPSPWSVRRLIASRGSPWMKSRQLGIWWVSYLYGLVWGRAAFASLLSTPSPKGKGIRPGIGG
jgi:glycosyltransferase AglE